MGNTISDIYMPDLGEVITVRYGSETGVGSVTGKVSKVYGEDSKWLGFGCRVLKVILESGL